MNHCRFLSICSAMCLLTWPHIGHTVSFGVYDARTQALAGTSVAMGDLSTGHFYNPALTALHRGDEDDTLDGRHSLPITMQLSSSAEVAINALQDDLEGTLSSAIDNFNASPNVVTALAGDNAAVDLQTAMIDMADGRILADIYAGYSISEPGEREGGAFFIGTRVVGNGMANIEDSDIDLIGNYIEALRFIHTAGAEGTAHPELFLANGQLADPNESILSSAMARVGVFTEMGLSGAKMVQLWGQTFSFGIAPKATTLKLYDDDWSVVDGDFESEGVDQSHWYFNVDLGVIWAPGDAWLIGLSTKDVITKHFSTELGYNFALRPRTRLGFAYNLDKIKVGMDLDVMPNQTFTSNEKQQDITLGVEYTLFKNLNLRAGYYHDIKETFGDKLSLGIGLPN